MKKHKQFSVITKPAVYDIVSGILWNLDIEGITETDFGLIIYANGQSTVTLDEINTSLDGLKKENLIETYNVEETEIEEINWNEEWEKKIGIINVTDTLTIKPTFKNYTPKEGETVIVIDPKMSFGTGEHETTKLVLSFLETVDLQNKTVLDVGSGTAVLAIGSVKLGAKHATAVDNDEWCYINGMENAERNDVTDKLTIVEGIISDIGEADFDVVLANINKNILLDIAEDINGKLKMNGTLILSGLLIEDEDSIGEHYKKKGFQFIEKKVMNEWIALKMEKIN